MLRLPWLCLTHLRNISHSPFATLSYGYLHLREQELAEEAHKHAHIDDLRRSAAVCAEEMKKQDCEQACCNKTVVDAEQKIASIKQEMESSLQTQGIRNTQYISSTFSAWADHCLCLYSSTVMTSGSEYNMAPLLAAPQSCLLLVCPDTEGEEGRWSPSL